MSPPPHVPPPVPPIQRRPRRRWLPWVLSALTIAVGAAALAVATAVPATPDPAAPATPPADEGIGDGTWIVGVDITPGTYGSDGARPGQLCQASTHAGRDADSDLVDWITATDGPIVIEVGDDVGALVTLGCEPWRLIT